MSKKTTEKWTCIGRTVRKAKNKYVYRHQYLDETGESMLFGSPLGGASKRSCDVIGGIYEGEVTRNGDDDCSAHGTWRYQGQEASQEQLMAWKAADINAQASMEEYNAEMKDKATNPILEVLEPLKKAYWRSSTVGKRRLIAEVIEYMTRHP